jgi:hypothetical protein
MSGPSVQQKIARLVSWIGHPLLFVMASVTIVLVSQMKSRAALPILAGLFFSVIAPTALLLIFGVRSGRWQDADVSVPEERKQFYYWAIPISAAGVVVTRLMQAPTYILRGAAVTFALLILAALINCRLKISLHTLFACYCTVVLGRVGLAPAIVALILAGFVFWSRLALRRHTLIENVAGVIVGTAGGLAAAWWPH